MAFSEKIKLIVKQKAAFQCCRCHEIGIDVHHIVAESEGGSDELDNAAPLCQNCHDRFGANPEKRKEIRQMRDWWCEVVEEKYTGDQKKLQEINEIILQIQTKQDNHDKNIQELQKSLEDRIDSLRDKISKNSPSKTIKDIQHQASELISATRLADNVFANVRCKNCNTQVGLLIGNNKCPMCKQSL